MLRSRGVIASWLDVAVDCGRVVIGSNPYLFRGGKRLTLDSGGGSTPSNAAPRKNRGGQLVAAAALLLAMLPRGRTGGAIGRGGA